LILKALAFVIWVTPGQITTRDYPDDPRHGTSGTISPASHISPRRDPRSTTAKRHCAWMKTYRGKLFALLDRITSRVTRDYPGNGGRGLSRSTYARRPWEPFAYCPAAPPSRAHMRPFAQPSPARSRAAPASLLVLPGGRRARCRGRLLAVTAASSGWMGPL
jgi:hypothetical protein